MRAKRQVITNSSLSKIKAYKDLKMDVLKLKSLIVSIWLISLITEPNQSLPLSTTSNKFTAKNDTIDLSWIIGHYSGECHGFATTMMYQKENCRPVFKTNMICAGTCSSTVYPKGSGLKEFCKSCQAKRIIWERIRFLCPDSKVRKVQHAWIQVVDGCKCGEVPCGMHQ
eukprot:Seg3897.3 transcript_id=Seg3897.3/GoldUCD/mRNA.D3Y31 product="hypothetical protein" protein_id=Seg3897.3/GoldUCD/D3Y31